MIKANAADIERDQCLRKMEETTERKIKAWHCKDVCECAAPETPFRARPPANTAGIAAVPLHFFLEPFPHMGMQL